MTSSDEPQKQSDPALSGSPIFAELVQELGDPRG